jgi:3',5'-cyclic AMP phosphodiesterase CpdA
MFATLLDRIVEDGNSFVVHLGDLVENGTAAEFQRWREMMADYSIAFFPVPGNHDANEGSLAEYLAFTGVAGAHYSFDMGLVHFAMVDSHRGYLTAEESAWLEADLAGTRQPVKIVALHYPPFDPRGSDYVMTRGNETFLSLMNRYDVQYVFAGHIHAYDQASRDGVIYIMSGGGGAPLRRSEEEGGFFHYVRVTVDGTDVRTEVRRLTP